jgi:hypothetical protein
MALTKITSTNIGANAVTSTALNLTTLSAGNTVITGTANVSTTLRAGNTTIVGFANISGYGSGTFAPYNDPVVVKGQDYTYLHLQGTNNQAAVIYNRNGTNGWFHGLDNNGNMKLVAMAAMDGTGLGNAKDGTAAMLVDTSGRITTPYQSLAVVGRDGGDVASQTSPIPYNQTITNVGNCWNGSTYRFTAQVAGYYYMSINALANNSTGVEVAIRKNGSATVVNTRGYGNGTSCSAAGIIYLAVSDYVDAKVEGSYAMNGGNGYAYSGMTVYLLG